MDNPVQVKRSTGLENSPQQELRSSSIGNIYPCREHIELLRSSMFCGCVSPCCTSFARGYPCTSPTDLGINESIPLR
jgi:hypothetical protein